ncbi:O-antigen ligase family protein [Thiofilum flexile]|uniref:O-antigen ligase family protein n=1 Tax=Thiofilum flexile TaxID=125627 RepID=UPI000371CF45|nr:O-antigen ligase family protein [Thiofilum flexile]
MTLVQRCSLLIASILLMVLPLPHTVAIRVLALVLALGVVIYQWRLLDVPKVPCFKVLLAWLVIPLLLLPYAVDWRYSLSEIKVEIGYGLVGFIIFLALSSNEQWLRFFIAVLGLSAAFYSLIGVAQFIPLEVWNELSLVGGSASFSTYIITLIPLILPAWYLFPKHHGYLIVILVLMVLGGLLTGQRIVFIVFIAQLLLVILLLKPQYVSVQKILIFIATVIITLGTIAFFTIQARDRVIGMIPLAEDPRLIVLERTLTILGEKPETGFGFGRNAMKLAHPEINDIMWHAHNTLLNYGISLGFLGIILIAVVWYCLLLGYWRIQRCSMDPFIKATAVAGICLVVGVVLRNQVNDMFHRDLSLLFWCINGMLLGFLLRQSSTSNG